MGHIFTQVKELFTKHIALQLGLHVKLSGSTQSSGSSSKAHLRSHPCFTLPPAQECPPARIWCNAGNQYAHRCRCCTAASGWWWPKLAQRWLGACGNGLPPVVEVLYGNVCNSSIYLQQNEIVKPGGDREVCTAPDCKNRIPFLNLGRGCSSAATPLHSGSAWTQALPGRSALASCRTQSPS